MITLTKTENEQITNDTSEKKSGQILTMNNG